MEDRFREFLDWVTKEAESRDGDLLSQMSSYWETWSTLNGLALTAVEQAARERQRDPAAQRAFLEWLQAQPEFQAGRASLVLYQLAQCKPFCEWDALAEYQSLSDDVKKNGVYAGFVLKGQQKDDGHPEHNASANRVVAVLIPRSNDLRPETRVKLRPVNFEAYDDAKAALETSDDAVQRLLRIGTGVLLAGAFLFGNSLLLGTFPRALMLFVWGRRVQRVLRQSDCYALLEVKRDVLVEKVEGASIGIAAALALLLAGLKTCFDEGRPRSPGNYVKFVNRSFPRLATSGFTGAISRDGGVWKVDEKRVEAKLTAMEERGLKRAVLPKENRRALRKEFGLELCGATSLAQVLLWLMDLRPLSVFANCALVGMFAAGFWLWPDLGDLIHSVPELVTVETSEAEFALPYLRKQDMPVYRVERIILHFADPRDDERTIVEVRISPRPGQAAPLERLEYAGKRLEDAVAQVKDLHPSLDLTVVQGQARFYYRYLPDPCASDLQSSAFDALDVIISRKGRLATRYVARYSLTLAVK